MDLIDVVWLSIDPVNNKIDYYPKIISQRIEKSYNERSNFITSQCVLGMDFFNATINFTVNGSCYQTTPGIYLGRNGIKQPGYRSVKRIVLNSDNIEKKIVIYSKKIRGEYRLANCEENYDKIFNEKVPDDVIINSDNTNDNNIIDNVSYWKPEDLNSESLDKNVIIWQWCKGVTEVQGNVLALSDDWWIPYLYEQNKKIEEEFNNDKLETSIILPFDNSERSIKYIFDYNTNKFSCFAKQVRCNGFQSIGERTIRRKIISIQELRELFSNINKISISLDDFIYKIENDDSIEVPNEFYCCISQSIMKNPTRTIDGHIYDYESINRWFQYNDTSPLTGLHLACKTLEPHNELKIMIETFIKEKTN